MDARGLVSLVNNVIQCKKMHFYNNNNIFQAYNSPLNKTLVDIAIIPSLKSIKINLCACHFDILLIHLKL